MNHNFKELRIWQKGIDLANTSYDYAATLPKDERFNLVSQITRSACSIPSNIAEGCGKRTPNHFAEFLSMSLGSCFELETHLTICEKRNFGNQELRAQLTEKIGELKNMIFNFREKIQKGDRS